MLLTAWELASLLALAAYFGGLVTSWGMSYAANRLWKGQCLTLRIVWRMLHDSRTKDCALAALDRIAKTGGG